MREMREASEFLLDLYRSARGEPPQVFQRKTLERLRDLISFDFAAWGGGGAEERDVTEVVVLDQSARLFGEWGAVAAEDAYCDLALQRLDHTVLFDDVPNFRRTLAWNEHWRRFDAHNMVATIMAEPIDGYVSFVGLCNATPSRPFDDHDRALKELLMPHLSSALRLSRESFALAAAGPGEGVALVDRAGRILASREPFSSLARDEWSTKAARVPASVLSASSGSGRWRGRTIQLQIKRLEHHYLVLAKRRDRLDQLTHREQEVALAFAEGLSYRKVGERLQIAPATARNHLARIYDKLGISTKSELVQLCCRVDSSGS
jgi:DNA-binding CsgD family transcriptional regulator